ncbi:MAG: hypothetical protein V3S10_03640 [Dehalococcoidales bacterium]
MSGQASGHFSARWDVRTGSPRKLWRTLHDFLDDNGFRHEYEELRLEESPIEGTATFSDTLTGYRDRTRPASARLLRIAGGVLLCLTLLLAPLGLRLIRSRTKTVRTSARVSVEGEVFRTRGANLHADRAAETVDVVADVRITMDILSGEPAEDDPREIRAALAPRELVLATLEFDELESGLAGLLPPGETTLPSTELREI